MFYYFRLCIFAVVEMDNRNLYTNKQNIMEAKYITLTKENMKKNIFAVLSPIRNVRIAMS